MVRNQTSRDAGTATAENVNCRLIVWGVPRPAGRWLIACVPSCATTGHVACTVSATPVTSWLPVFRIYTLTPQTRFSSAAASAPNSSVEAST